nr:replication protein A 70 kDa DNA-binding subunit B [Tanacetum cinerariifolium]
MTHIQDNEGHIAANTSGMDVTMNDTNKYKPIVDVDAIECELKDSIHVENTFVNSSFSATKGIKIDAFEAQVEDGKIEDYQVNESKVDENSITTLAEHIIVAEAENCPPMLEKSMYDSLASRIRLFIKEKKHGRMMLDLIKNGPLVYPAVEKNGQTRPMKYSELTEAQQLQDDYDVQATNIILHGLTPDVYALVNHQEVAKDIWDKVKLLMKGTELSYQERKCRLYNLFDKFSYV